MKQDNRIIVDLSKVQWARFYYENRYGQQVDNKPMSPTIRGYPLVTARDIQEAIKLGGLDSWTPRLKLKLTANECLLFSGDKAISIYKEWCARIFQSRTPNRTTRK